MMATTIEALFDGTALHPAEPLELAPNTCVRITIETLPPPRDTPISFLDVARALDLDGPSDWSTNLDAYLSGGKARDDS
jgi:hypothetical protein